jgi:xylose isomerase
MRTYLILKERARQWREDREIQALVASLGSDGGAASMNAYSARHRDDLLAAGFDRAALAARGLGYERLDQLTMEILLGAR